jgi:hypothetical protein
MLRQAAKPSEPTRTDDVRLWLGVHDLSRVEWTAVVPLPERDQRRYEIEFAVDIPATLFASHNVWEHLQIFTRLRSPAEEGPLAVESDDVEELRRDTLGVAHRLKTMKVRFERACVGAAAVTREQPDAELGELLVAKVVGAFELVTEMRRQLETRPPAGEEAERERALADEFLSYQLIDFFAGCERGLDEVLLGPTSRVRESETRFAEELRCLIAEGLSEELAHRRGRGYVNPRADAPQELAKFLERASRLKKHFQDVLYLDVEAWFVDSRVRNYVGIVAAALAATAWLSFTLLPIGPGARAGLGLGTFAVVFALAYAVKDRIKEMARGWITGRLMRLYGQRMVTLRLPRTLDGARRVLAETRERFDVDALSDALGSIGEASASAEAVPRRMPASVGEASAASRVASAEAVPRRMPASVGAPRRVMRLHFRMRSTLSAAPPLEQAHIDSVKHIFRYDLSPIFARLDNAVKQVPVLDPHRRVRFADAAREYRFPVRISFVSVGGERLVEQAHLVLSKRGIERIEHAQ